VINSVSVNMSTRLPPDVDIKFHAKCVEYKDRTILSNCIQRYPRCSVLYSVPRVASTAVNTQMGLIWLIGDPRRNPSLFLKYLTSDFRISLFTRRQKLTNKLLVPDAYTPCSDPAGSNALHNTFG